MDCNFTDGLMILAQSASVNASDVAADQPSAAGPWIAIAIAAAVLILPFVVGSFLAKAMRMPQMATRLGFILLAVNASAVVLLNKLPGLGVDLRGGTILVYEIDPSKNEQKQADGGQRIQSESLVEPLTQRINPSGTQEIVIRPYGENQIEIIVPEVDQREVDRIKQLIEEAGILRFAIVANQADHQAIIDLARTNAESDYPLREIVGSTDGLLYGRWVAVGREANEVDGVRPFRLGVGNATLRNPDTGNLVNPPAQALFSDEPGTLARWVADQGMSGLEILMVIDPLLDVKGEDLSFASGTVDERGGPAVAFNLTDQGSGRFRALTTNNAPVGTRQRQLGIVLDDVLLSAPTINEPISKQGRITGNFTREEVDRLVAVLEAGQLPAALTPQPIAENQIDATLGKDTIEKGVWAIGVSLILVLVFILVYYMFSGVVACIALLLNLAMILATMVLINQPLTLPGLAGLVLTVGMSVDANVLIFERIREELKKGAKPRMAIRNGFGRATTTIIDANLTTLITAIVLYAIGTDQIRGFAVTLILGILFSMFTAIYVSRTIFDIAEKKGFLSLGMLDFVNGIRSSLAGGGQFDFMGKGKVAMVVSGLLVTLGIASLVMRGSSIFDIDFAGGSSVQFRVDRPVDTDQVRAIVDGVLVSDSGDDLQGTVNGVSIEGIPDGTVFKVDAPIDQVDDLKALIERGFENSDVADLVTYQVSITPAGDASWLPRRRSLDPSRGLFDPQTGTTLAAAYAQEDDANGDEASDGDSAEGESDETMDVELPGIVFSTAVVQLGVGDDDAGAAINGKTLIDKIVQSASAAGVEISDREIKLTPMGDNASEWAPDSALTFDQWKVQLPMGQTKADAVMSQLESDLSSEPIWISSSSVGSRVAGDMISRALGALFASLLSIIAYIWFRFQRVIYGVAAVCALIHDVLITLGAIAVSYWLADALGFLLIDPFKISLTVVAALLTIIGYSLNDTIVVFDRIRETKGKSPRLTGEMINSSINQTLSRTLLTSITTLIVVVLLYAFGGAGIHAFAFCLVIGVLVGTYSSIFVASPILLWLVNRGEAKAAA
ncbi:protein translocase subunit SecD [Crateriforma conspicua]|uniref:Multifunctional fusion protein n=1 Tax=Crateriforma conspicua TaxID=2527996 RepID=A0A5C6G0H4_9PLAN|nr:protein translocase subunit SecD [Crateriforma conspicua]TWU67385.1 bifunctional preprotein translocase subunit SecD/SecF [Crateriforma conspicua]